MTMVADPLRVVSDLPEGWLPEPAVILGFSFEPADGDEAWEVLLADYTIAGRGDSFHAALEESMELLEDYWRMCASEGLSFEQARRPIRPSWFASLLTRAVAGAIRDRLRDHASRRPRLLKFPVEERSPHIAV
jgi:hypothetical protein